MKEIDLNKICKDYGICACSYSDNPEIVKKNRLKELGTSGISFKMTDGTPAILFDSSLSPMEVRFTVAHELGHILLGHLDYRGSMKEAYPAFAESEANYFAVSMLVYDIIRQYGDKEAHAK